MKSVIESPFIDGKAYLHRKPKKLVFRGEEFEVCDHYYKCETTGKEFSTSETGDITMMQLYNQYREKNDILFPEQISDIREKYGVSAARMSAILGFGPNVYKSYEKGDIPSKSNSKLINIARDPKLFYELAVESKLLSNSELSELKKKTEQLVNDQRSMDINKFLRISSDKIDQYSGYRKRCFDKLANMVLFFIENQRTFTTRLNKYLFYSDFLSYRNTGYSISGFTYCAIDNGPVLDDYKRLFSMFWETGFVESKEVELEGETFEQFVPAKKFEKRLFTSYENEILKAVLDSLKYKSTKSIIDLSHEEDAWKKNITGTKEISYQKYAFGLKWVGDSSVETSVASETSGAVHGHR